MRVSIDRSKLRDIERREPLLQVLEAALAAVEPQKLVSQSLELRNRELRVQGIRVRVDRKRVWVLSIGKAACAMAQAAVDRLGSRIAGGLVLTRYGYARQVAGFRVLEAGHPEPDEAGERAANEIEDLARKVGSSDVVLVLLSGGGSALLAAPASGIALEDLMVTNHALVRSGATIDEINVVRRHLSRLKGGWLMERLYPATVLTLILSDVPVSRLESIASGPTVPDPTTFLDAARIVDKYGLEGGLPDAVHRRIRRGVSGRVLETSKPGNPVFEHSHAAILGDNRTAVEAAIVAAEKLGCMLIRAREGLVGEAQHVGAEIGRTARLMRKGANPCLGTVYGGETTVRVRGEGAGGRCQEAALAAALEIVSCKKVQIAFLATDGTDGITDAAGAIVDGSTIGTARDQGWSAADGLRQNNSHPVLSAAQDVLYTGPTGTNVADLCVVWSKIR